MTGIADFSDGHWRIFDRISLSTERTDGTVMIEGTITLRSHDAVVSFYAYSYRHGNQWTGLTFVRNGREWRRTWKRTFAKRTLYRLARQFLDDLGVERVR